MVKTHSAEFGLVLVKVIFFGLHHGENLCEGKITPPTGMQSPIISSKDIPTKISTLKALLLLNVLCQKSSLSTLKSLEDKASSNNKNCLCI